MSSTAAGEQVLADTIQAAASVLGGEIEAIYALGSLAHGGFAPLVSDVDVAVVLAATDADTAAQIAEVARRVVEGSDDQLAERLSVFWGDWDAVRTGEGEHLRLGPIDRLDLLDSGRLLVGSDRREPCVRPSHLELVLMSSDHMLGKFTDEYLERLRDIESLLAGGPRAVTKAVLFPVRFLYTLATGRIGLNNDSAGWWADEELPGGALALEAIEWRSHGIPETELAQQMLEIDLATIHAECFEQYARQLDDLGEADRAGALAERAARVRVPSADAL